MHNAFYSCGIFMFTFVASIIGIHHDRKRQRELDEEGLLLAGMLASNQLTGISDYNVNVGLESSPEEGHFLT